MTDHRDEKDVRRRVHAGLRGSHRDRCAALRAAALALCSALPIAGCGDRAGDADPLMLAAAADLAATLPALTQAFEEESGIRVVATIGASGMLAQQIEHGAPIDVFLSADRSLVDRLEAAGRTVRGTRVTYAEGSLALVLAPGTARAPGALDALSDARFRRIAIANPDVAPYGRAARQALERSGVWTAVQPRLIIAENVRQALEYVATGNVDAAIVARSLVPDDAAWIAVPDTLHEPLHQDAVVVSGTRREADARRFLAFLTESGRAILLRHHFTATGTIAR